MPLVIHFITDYLFFYRFPTLFSWFSSFLHIFYFLLIKDVAQKPAETQNDVLEALLDAMVLTRYNNKCYKVEIKFISAQLNWAGAWADLGKSVAAGYSDWFIWLLKDLITWRLDYL